MKKEFNQKMFSEFKESVVSMRQRIINIIVSSNMVMCQTLTESAANNFLKECAENNISIELNVNSHESIEDFMDYIAYLYHAKGLALEDTDEPTINDMVKYYHICQCDAVIYQNDEATDEELFNDFGVMPLDMLNDEKLKEYKVLFEAFEKYVAYYNENDETELLYDILEKISNPYKIIPEKHTDIYNDFKNIMDEIMEHSEYNGLEDAKDNIVYLKIEDDWDGCSCLLTENGEEFLSNAIIKTIKKHTKYKETDIDSVEVYITDEGFNADIYLKSNNNILRIKFYEYIEDDYLNKIIEEIELKHEYDTGYRHYLINPIKQIVICGIVKNEQYYSLKIMSLGYDDLPNLKIKHKHELKEILENCFEHSTW